jgi:hypothetical protein
MDYWLPPATVRFAQKLGGSVTRQYTYALHWTVVTLVGNDLKPATELEIMFSTALMLTGAGEYTEYRVHRTVLYRFQLNIVQYRFQHNIEQYRFQLNIEQYRFQLNTVQYRFQLNTVQYRFQLNTVQYRFQLNTVQYRFQLQRGVEQANNLQIHTMI